MHNVYNRDRKYKIQLIFLFFLYSILYSTVMRESLFRLVLQVPTLFPSWYSAMIKAPPHFSVSIDWVLQSSNWVIRRFCCVSISQHSAGWLQSPQWNWRINLEEKGLYVNPWLQTQCWVWWRAHNWQFQYASKCLFRNAKIASNMCIHYVH